MQFPSLALLACSLLVQQSAAYQPYLRTSDGIQGCFEGCDKDVDKASKTKECQDQCVADAEGAGSARSSLGPTGADNLLICAGDCADDAESKYKKESKVDCKCEKDDEACEDACKEEEKKAEKEAESKAEKEYKSCNDKCFEARSFLPYLRKSEGIQGCIEKCTKDVDKASKTKECQDNCVAEAEGAGSARSSLGPTGADDLLTCAGGCADDAESKYKKESKGDKCKCEKEDEECKRACKEEEKKAEKEAQSKAEKEYKSCSDKCFGGGSFFGFKFA